MTTFNTRVTFDHVRNTEAGFTAANPILGYGVIGLETDSGRAKIGDGVTAWGDLGYFTGEIDWAGITDKPSTFTPSTHNHDDRYYTESETDTLLAGKQAAGSYVLTTDSRLTDAREWSAATVSQSDAETGTSTDRKAFTPLRVFQAIAAWWAGSSAAAKLNGIAANATANQSDAYLLDRSHHTGTQTASTISDFTSAVVAAAPPTTDASLLTTGTLPDARLSSNIARTSDVSAAVAAVVDAAPAALDTLNELAAALGDDASFSATVTNALAAKAPLASPTFTGTVSGITKGMVGLGSVDNTSDASKPVSTAQAAADAAVQSYAVQRANHTGTQAASTISDFNSVAAAAAPVQSVAGRTGNVTIAAADVSGLGSLATASSVAYGDLTGTPSTFAPSAHKSSHAVGGSDALTPADIGASAEGHAHSATSGEITGLATVATSGSAADLTGTLAAARLPATTVTAGSYGSASSVATFTVDAAGRLTAAGSTSIAIAAGAVSGLATVATSGSYSDLSNKPAAYSLPTATATVLGGVKIGSGVSIDGSGVISVSTYSLPNATTSTLGGVIVGTGLGVASGTVSVTYGTTSGTACQGNDSRLSDARTPTSHASTHQTGGADFVANVVNSPSQITSNQNDYSLPSADVVRLSSDAARDITGFAAGSSGQVIVLVNVGSFAITLKHQSTSSTAANRVVVPWGNDFAIPADGSATLIYDSTTSRWRAL